MKVLIFAHTPPPHHGQSYMVQRLLQALPSESTSADPIECFHVNARFSDSVGQIGRFEWKKMWRVVKYCISAVFLRFRHNIPIFYYIPAPAIKSAIYRDWIVMLLCRPFFRKTVFHWHACGLGEWMQSKAKSWERTISRRLLGHPSLSIVLTNYNRHDAMCFKSKKIAVVPNGIPDPCPNFNEVHARRLARTHLRQNVIETRSSGSATRATSRDFAEIRVLFVSLCHREKGLFDSIEAVAVSNQRLREKGIPLSFRLVVAGKFFLSEEEAEFRTRIAKNDLVSDGKSVVEYRGFLSGDEKAAAFENADCLCFPTYYNAESFGLVLIEAMAYGLPVVTTRWRGISELFPKDYYGFVEPRSPEQIAVALTRFITENPGAMLREHFLEEFTEKKAMSRLADLLRKL